MDVGSQGAGIYRLRASSKQPALSSLFTKAEWRGKVKPKIAVKRNRPDLAQVVKLELDA